MKSGELGEKAAEMWFQSHGWHMVRTQPPIRILGMVTPAILSAIRRVSPRMAFFGHMIIARFEAGGVPDFTGYRLHASSDVPIYVACEVKEAGGTSMPCSRASKSQREFLSRLPEGSAFVGIFWTDIRRFQIFAWKKKGSYLRF